MVIWDDLSGPKEMIMTFKIREAGRSKAEKCDLEAEVMQGCKPENEQALEAGKGKDNGSLLEAPEGIWPCLHLDYRPILDSLPPEL